MSQKSSTRTSVGKQRRRQSRQASRAPVRELRQDARSVTVHRRELWYTISTLGLTRLTFSDVQFPIWFGQFCRLYETYELLDAKIIVKSAYNSLANGLSTVSYNNNKQQGPPASPEYMLQQVGARQERINKTIEVNLHPSIFRATPTRRFTSGTNSYLFHADIWIASSDRIQPVSVYLEYTARFHTPQADEQLTTVYGISREYSGSQTFFHDPEVKQFEDGWGVRVQPGEEYELAFTFQPTDAEGAAHKIGFWNDGDEQTMAIAEFSEKLWSNGMATQLQGVNPPTGATWSAVGRPAEALLSTTQSEVPSTRLRITARNVLSTALWLCLRYGMDRITSASWTRVN